MYHTRNGLDELDEQEAVLDRKCYTRLSRRYGRLQRHHRGMLKSGTYSRSFNAKFMANVIPSR